MKGAHRARAHGHARFLPAFGPQGPRARRRHAAAVRGSAVSVFCWPARVYWEDTDGGGIVYYASYLRFLERARTEWLRARGHSQQELSRERGIVFAVASLTVEYRSPARLDDELEVTCEPEPLGAASIGFAQRIYRIGPGGGTPGGGKAAPL